MQTRQKTDTLFRKVLNELRESNDKKTLPFGLQKHSSLASIVGAYASIGLTIIIFIYTCNTRTKVEGWSDLIRKQDESNHKQDTFIQQQIDLNNKQDIFIQQQTLLNQKQDSIISSLEQLAKKQDAEIALMKGQVTSLQSLVEKNQKLDSLSNQQNLKMQGVLKNVEDMLRVQIQNQDAEIFKSYHELYSIIKSFPRFEYDDWVGDTKIFSESWEITTKEFCKTIVQRMDVGMANPYLKYDSTAGAKWFKMYFLVTDLINIIDAKLPYIPPPNWEDNRRMKMHGLYASFIDDYPKFLSYFNETGTSKIK